MALGGFLAGLAEASKQLPETIQTRRLLQIRDKQAQARRDEALRRSQEASWEQRQDIIENLRYLAEKGEPEAVTEALGGLSEEPFPGLATALIGIAEDAAFQYNQETDERTIDNQYKQAQTDALSNPKWQSRTGSQFLYRTDPKTGFLEQTLGPSPDPKPPKVLKLIASAGAILNAVSYTHLTLPTNREV